MYADADMGQECRRTLASRVTVPNGLCLDNQTRWKQALPRSHEAVAILACSARLAPAAAGGAAPQVQPLRQRRQRGIARALFDFTGAHAFPGQLPAAACFQALPVSRLCWQACEHPGATMATAPAGCDPVWSPPAHGNLF